MKIKWNGHASFTITASDGTVLITDPYDPSGYGGVLKYDTVSDKADAAKVAEALKARLVIPMHFKTDKCDLPITEVDSFLTKMTNVKKLEESEIELSLDKLPAAGPEVWVMNHAC